MKNIFKHYRKEFAIFLSVLFFLQLTLFNTNNLVFADTNTPAISYSIQGDTTVGSIIEIAVNISNAKDLYGGSIDFVYDTSLLEVQSISKGSIFGSNKIITPLGDNGKISNGQASFGISLTGSQSGVTKNNEILAIIKAKVLKEGTVKLSTTSSNTSALSLNGFTARVKLSNSKAQSISYDSKNSNIQLLAKAKVTSYEENNPLITYSGYWSDELVSSNSNGNAKYSNATNASFTFSFEGTGFRWYGLSNQYKGIANIYIDGIKQSLDTYISSTAYKTLFFEKANLDNVRHTVKIEVSGSKGPTSEGSFIHVDRIDILNGKLINTTPITSVTSYEENDSAITYSGYWTNEAVSSNSGGNAKYSNATNASFTFSFEGTGFRWYGFANENKGIANVYIDGIKQTVDTFTGNKSYKTLFFEKPNLDNGKHTVKIEVSGNKNPNAYSNFIHIDKIEILNGTLIGGSPAPTINSYEENNPLIKYYGYWVDEAVSSNSGGNGKYSNTTNASLTFSFEGTGFRWYGFANQNKGIANVYIDGVKQTVDTFTGSTKYKTLFFEKTGLAQGKHTVKIEVSGSKNPASYSNFIHIDSIDILNGNLVDDSTPTEVVTSYEENNPLIKYYGYWANEAVSSNSGGNGKYSNSANASLTFSFEGTGFRWYGFANENKGIANVYIDGVKQTVDTFTGSTKYKTLFLEKKGLTQGKHTVKIEVSGNKNPAAYSNFIHVDTIDILNGNLVQ